MLEKLLVMSSDDSLERTASSSGISSGIESTAFSSHILHTNASNNSVLPADSLHLSERSEASLHEISILSGQHSTSAPGLLETIQNLHNPIGDFAFGESVYSTQQESSFSTANDQNRDAGTFILDLRRFLETRSDGASIEERQLIHEVETLLNSVPITGSQYNQENQNLSNHAEENQRSGRVSESGMDHYPGLTSIHRKCLSYNSIHQVCGKTLVIQFSYNLVEKMVEKIYKLISVAV